MPYPFCKKHLFFFLFVFLAFQSRAQVSNYIFTTTASAYVPVTGGITLGTVNNDDECFNNQDIGFNFLFNGKLYNKVSINVNGFIAMGPYVISSFQPINNGLSNNVISAFGYDIQSSSLVKGELMTLLSGTAPNRVFTIQWSKYYGSAANDNYSFQIRLLENGSVLEVVYGQIVQSSGQKQIQVGLRGNSNAEFANRSVTTSQNTTWATSMPGLFNGATCDLNNLGQFPAEGLTYRWELPSVDIGISGLISPLGCYGADQDVIMELKNLGKTAINFQTTPVTVSASVSGPNPRTFPSVIVNKGSANPGESINVTLDTLYDMSLNGDYYFAGSIDMSGDAYAGNDILPSTKRSASYVLPVNLPLKVDFSGFDGSNLDTVFPLWSEASGPAGEMSGSAWANSTGTQRAFFEKDENTARITLYTNTQQEWIIGPRFVAKPNTYLRYKAAVTNSGGIDAANMGADDLLRVLISPDCGISWITVDSLNQNSAVQPWLIQHQVFLGDFAGQELIPAFLATDGPEDNSEYYDLHLDAISVNNMVSKDAGVTGIVSPRDGNCAQKETKIGVIVENYGFDVLQNIPVEAFIGSPFNYLLTDTLTGSLSSGETDTLFFSGSFDSNPGGMLNITARTRLLIDSAVTNDAYSFTVFMNSNPPMPAASDAVICAPGGTATLYAEGQGTICWYNQPEKGTLLYTGPEFLTPYLTQTTPFYVEAADYSPNELYTGFDGQNQASGNMFDLTALNRITIDSLDVHVLGDPQTVKLYYKTGSYVGHENNPSSWTLLDSVDVEPSGLGLPTRAHIGNLTIPEGETYGIYITSVQGTMRYTATYATRTLSDGNMLLSLGIGNTYPFTDIYSPRSWNGVIYYTFGCESERAMVQAIVEPCTGITATEEVVSIVPNPSEGIAELHHGNIREGLIEIVDMQGRLLRRQSVENAEHTRLDLSALPAGVYMLKLSSSSGQYTRKLTIR